nr:hypothetical protein [uncultured bacterium]
MRGAAPKARKGPTRRFSPFFRRPQPGGEMANCIWLIREMTTPMSRTSYYVDGFNLYHAIKPLARPELKWLNLHALATSFLGADDRLAEVTYFTAMLMWNAEKCRRHQAYMDALSAYGVTVVESKFIKSNRFCRQYKRYCNFHEEKQTDVALAVKVLRDAHRGLVERAILVTADSDQIPLIREIRESFPTLSVEIAAPPGRMREARELCSVASRFSEISAGRLRTCLLPRNVLDEHGRTVAVCPARYLPNPA